MQPGSGRGGRGVLRGRAAKVDRHGDRGREQQYGDRPQPALDQVAQESSHGIHFATSDAVAGFVGVVAGEVVTPVVAAPGVVVDVTSLGDWT